MEAKKIRQVKPGTLTLAEMKKAMREGRLYIEPSKVTESDRRQMAIREILKCVGHLDSCASEEYSDVIVDIWKTIVSHEQIAPELFLRYGRNEGKPRYYCVLSIVNILLEANVYNHHAYRLKDLCNSMDLGKDAKRYYNGYGAYNFDGIRRVIKRIVTQANT